MWLCPKDGLSLPKNIKIMGTSCPTGPQTWVVPSTPNSALESPDEVVHNGCVHKCGKEEVEPQWAHGPWAALRECFKGNSLKGMLNIGNGWKWGKPREFPFHPLPRFGTMNTVISHVSKHPCLGGPQIRIWRIDHDQHTPFGSFWEISSDALHPPRA